MAKRSQPGNSLKYLLNFFPTFVCNQSKALATWVYCNKYPACNILSKTLYNISTCSSYAAVIFLDFSIGKKISVVFFSFFLSFSLNSKFTKIVEQLWRSPFSHGISEKLVIIYHAHFFPMAYCMHQRMMINAINFF